MDNELKRLNKRIILFAIISFAITILFSIITILLSSKGTINYLGLAASSRTLTGFFGGLLGAMVFIISLTSTTYTPKISSLFLHHPIAGLGIGTIVFCQMVLVFSGLFETNHWFHDYYMYGSLIISIFTIAIVMPYLYFLIHFINPKYFLPIIKKQIFKGIDKLNTEITTDKNIEKEIFDNIDVIMNVASTASKKDDKNLMKLTLEIATDILEYFIECHDEKNIKWRYNNPQFLPGISEEGQFYLENTKIWPEFYLIGKLVRRINSLDSTQDEIIPVVCENFLETIDECVSKGLDDILDLHLMAFNAMLKNAIDNKNPGRFQSISYSYRLAIEILVSNKKALTFSIKSFINYGNMAEDAYLKNCAEAILFDLGRILLFMGYKDEELAMDFLKEHAGPVWKIHMKRDNHLGNVAWRSIVKTYWEARGKGYTLLAKIMFASFIISDEKMHKRSLFKLFEHDRSLFVEINDRLISFSHFSTNAEKMARDFYDKVLSKLDTPKDDPENKVA